MKRIVKMLGLAMVLTAILVVALAGTVSASGPLGPNPLAGDGVSDGSSLDSPNGPCADCVFDECVPAGDEYKYSNGGSGEWGKYKNNQ